MKIIFGLGNPEKQYAKTRHNTGHMALEWVAQKHSAKWQTKTKLQAEQAQIEIDGAPVLLVRSTLNYNNNGLSLRKVKDFYGIDNKDILVIHDELVLPFGTLRVRAKGSDAGNNGIKNINEHISQDYTRIRIGIANETRKPETDIDFVLSNFARADAEKLPAIFTLVETIVQAFAAGTLDPVSHIIDLSTK